MSTQLDDAFVATWPKQDRRSTGEHYAERELQRAYRRIVGTVHGQGAVGSLATSWTDGSLGSAYTTHFGLSGGAMDTLVAGPYEYPTHRVSIETPTSFLSGSFSNSTITQAINRADLAQPDLTLGSTDPETRGLAILDVALFHHSSVQQAQRALRTAGEVAEVGYEVNRALRAATAALIDTLQRGVNTGSETGEELGPEVAAAGSAAAQAYPNLMRALKEGRVTGANRPLPGSRGLRLVQAETADGLDRLEPDGQVAIGRHGDPPADHVRRRRRL